MLDNEIEIRLILRKKKNKKRDSHKIRNAIKKKKKQYPLNFY